MPASRFTARIHKIGINPVVDVPARISAAFGRKGYVPVLATLGKKSFPANLVPVGGGRHRLFLNLAMRQAAGRDVGHMIVVRLEPDAKSRVLKTPPDLARALRTAGHLREFEGLTPSHRKEIIRWITQAKTAETRARRLDRAVKHFPREPYRA